MESLSFSELKNFGDWLQLEMTGAQLQDLWTNGQLIVFQFYKFKELYLLVDTRQQSPLVVYSEIAPRIEKKPKPLVLFLNSHGRNLRWEGASVSSEKGRVLEIRLTNGLRNCKLEIQLIPKAFNLIVEAEGKKVSWGKPRDLPLSITPPILEPIETDWKSFGSHWLQEKFQNPPLEKSKISSEGLSDQRKKALEKKKKALSAIEVQLGADPSVRWMRLGEILKVPGEIPEEFQDIYDSRKSRSWNLENSFSQAKHLQKKRAGTEERRDILRREILSLEEDLRENPHAVPKPQIKPQSSRVLEKAKSKGRRLPLEDNLEAVIGKSAADNLAILRQARAWDLWLHLKDYPGSHAIILRPRQKEVPHHIIQKVSEWLIRESLSSQKIQWGAKYEVVVVECRYVRPIKGDRLGRVTYHHPQVYSFASKI